MKKVPLWVSVKCAVLRQTERILCSVYLCSSKVFLVGNYLRFYIWSCHTGKVSHAAWPGLCIAKLDDSGTLSQLTKQLLWIFSKKKNVFSSDIVYHNLLTKIRTPAQIQRCALYWHRHGAIDWCLGDSMLSVLLAIFWKYFLSVRKKSKSVAWKAWKPPQHAAGLGATLPKHKAKISQLLGQVCTEWWWDP